jgi:hypothetical protein
MGALAKQAAAQEATLVIQDIGYERNFATSCDLIRRQVDIRPGRVVDESRIPPEVPAALIL